MNAISQLDLFAGRELRDEGRDRVADHNELWIDACRRQAEQFIGTRDTFTGEDIRLHCEATVGHPKHPNAWGSLVNILIKQHVIRPTGRHMPMRDPISHARMTPVYTSE